MVNYITIYDVPEAIFFINHYYYKSLLLYWFFCLITKSMDMFSNVLFKFEWEISWQRKENYKWVDVNLGGLTKRQHVLVFVKLWVCFCDSHLYRIRSPRVWVSCRTFVQWDRKFVYMSQPTLQKDKERKEMEMPKVSWVMHMCCIVKYSTFLTDYRNVE